jgi:hypothetical protein
VNSCESESKRALVQRLSGKLLARNPTIRSPQVGYVSFAAKIARREVRATEPEPSPLVPPLLESWESLLAWIIDTEPVVSGFVVNSEGFVIALTGMDKPSKCDGLGADLCLFFDEMRSVDPEAGELRSICLMFDEHWLVGIRSNHKQPSTVGLIATELRPGLIDAVVRAMASNQHNLR